MGKINIQASILADKQKVWDYYTLPQHITQWNFADPSWHCPSATNNMKIGGKYSARMEAKDGSFGFDFGGIYDEVRTNEYIEYTLGDGRKVKIDFVADNNKTKISESFEPESENPHELQKGGWQAILNNFKKYTENN